MDFHKLRSRSSLFFPPINERVNVVSFFIHFLYSITFELPLTKNFRIEFSSKHNWYFLTLFSEYFKVPTEMSRHLKEIFDLGHYNTDGDKKLVDTTPSFDLLRSIVWFSEYCIISITDDDKFESQAFLNAHAIGKLIQRPNQEGIKSKLSLQFNLSDSNLSLTKPTVSELCQAIEKWKEGMLARLLRNSNKNIPRIKENINNISEEFCCSVDFLCE